MSAYRLLLITVMLLAAHHTIQGQRISHNQQFETGHVVLTSGDTLRGELYSTKWTAEHSAVFFRANPGDVVRKIPLEELRAVHTIGSRQRILILPVDRYATTAVQNLDWGLVIRQKPAVLLVDMLLEGPTPLYTTTMLGTRHFWVQRNGQPILELTERHYFVKRPTNTIWVDGNMYRDQLSTYFGSCAPAAMAATQTPYTEAGIIAVVQAFNESCLVPNPSSGSDAR